MKKLRNNARGYILDMFAQHHMVKRTVLSFLSIVIMGFGTALFNVSGFGVDPFTSMNMSVAAVLGVSFGTYQLIINAVILLYVVIVAHRGLVGVGTVFNMAGVGYSCELFSSLLMPMVKQNDTLSIRIPLLLAGILVLCFACSLFFTANIGVGPYDALGFMLSPLRQAAVQMGAGADGCDCGVHRTAGQRRLYRHCPRRLCQYSKYRHRHRHYGLLYGPADQLL